MSEYVELGESNHQYDDIDLNHTRIVEARYVRSVNDEDRGNVFIEAVPPPRDNLDMIVNAYTKSIKKIQMRKKNKCGFMKSYRT